MNDCDASMKYFDLVIYQCSEELGFQSSFVEMSKLLRELCILKRGASVIPRRVVSAFKKYAVTRVSVFNGQQRES